MRRLLPLAIALGVGLVALLWGLAALESIVIDERHQARDGIASQEAVLAEYARRTLEQRLQAQLLEQHPAIEQAAEDPLAPAEGLLLIEDGRQRLPRRTAFVPGEEGPARALYDQLRRREIPPELEPGSPPQRRVELYLELRDALERAEVVEIGETMRAVLRHRNRFVLDSTFDLPLMIALLDDFTSRKTPAPELMMGLLREGFGRDPGARMAALQRALLRRRDRFTASDFRFLADRIAALSRGAGVPVDDFVALASTPARAPVPLPPRVTEPMLVSVEGGTFYVAPHSASSVRGVMADLPAAVDVLEEEMRRRGLLQPEDRVTLPPLHEATPLDTLPFVVDAPRLRSAWERAEERFWLKTGFVAACAALALSIVVLALLLQRRRYRFVELKSDFVATVSHELRTPLASIRLMAETLERRTRAVPAARDYPQRIVRDIDELSFLVENILSFNRLDKGRWQPRRTDVELRPLLDAVLEDLPQYGVHEVSLDAEGIDDVVLHGDRELLLLLLRNLVKNACTYNERHPIELRVQGRWARDCFVVEIADNGIGIPVQEHARIFEDFRRVAGTRARGSGLGLSICRKTMEAHGGRIRIVRSTPEGTRFALEFPGTMATARA
ncbi:HAMP domain-containing histidine kinase [Paraliomyxa miuraensis]|nr:HAMP domain-containing histidine kinase [Paraliomyxa miuraensis]